MTRGRHWIAISALLWALPLAAFAQSDSQTEAVAEEALDLEAIGTERAKRSSLQPVRPRISRYLQKAAKEFEEDNNEEAQAILARLNPKRLNSYERALVYRLQAYTAYGSGDSKKAIEYFEKCLAEEIVPIRDEVDIRFNVAQLYAGIQEWRPMITAMNEWFRYKADPEPLAYYLLAIAYFQLEEHDSALNYAEKAVDASPEPREGWLQLVAALLIGKEDFANAAPVFEELVIRYPKKEYWVQLSLIYGARDDFRQSLAAQQLAYIQGLLTKDKELRRLARGYLYHNLPYPAAKILSDGLESGAIESDADSYELLANSWIAAREYELSLDPLVKAADLSTNGKLYMRLGQVHLQREDPKLAAEMLEKSVDKGGLDSPGNALLLLGIAYYNDSRVWEARTTFARAKEHDKTRKDAEGWIKHIDNELQQADAAQSETGETGETGETAGASEAAAQSS